MRPEALLSFTFALVTACSSSDSHRDASLRPDASDDASLRPDAFGADARVDTGVPFDAGPPDSGPPLDAEPGDANADGSLSLDADAPDDAGDAPDGSPVATLGTGCAPNTKLATIEVSDEGGTRYVNATVLDAPPPWVGPPALTTNACIFHRASAGCACPTDEVCNFAGSCVSTPAPFASASVTLTGAAGNQTLSLDGSGSGWAEVSLPDHSLAVTLLADDARLITPSMSIPAVLGGLTGALGGSYDAPTSVDVSWAPVSGAHVFTHISINHHVPAPTFTECLVDGSSGSFHIGADMLTPLAVVTGLEFQGVEHVRLASAPLGSGCVEFRFTRRHYLSLF